MVPSFGNNFFIYSEMSQAAIRGWDMQKRKGICHALDDCKKVLTDIRSEPHEPFAQMTGQK